MIPNTWSSSSFFSWPFSLHHVYTHYSSNMHIYFCLVNYREGVKTACIHLILTCTIPVQHWYQLQNKNHLESLIVWHSILQQMKNYWNLLEMWIQLPSHSLKLQQNHPLLSKLRVKMTVIWWRVVSLKLARMTYIVYSLQASRLSRPRYKLQRHQTKSLWMKTMMR